MLVIHDPAKEKIERLAESKGPFATEVAQAKARHEELQAKNDSALQKQVKLAEKYQCLIHRKRQAEQALESARIWASVDVEASEEALVQSLNARISGPNEPVGIIGQELEAHSHMAFRKRICERVVGLKQKALEDATSALKAFEEKHGIKTS